MGNCVYYVPPALLWAQPTESRELAQYTHALYDARELAIERLQDEAEALAGDRHRRRHRRGARALRGGSPVERGNGALQSGEVIELFVVGTAVVPSESGGGLARPSWSCRPTTRPRPRPTPKRRRESDIVRPTPALSELSVTEFITLSRAGYFPHGLVIGSCIYEAGNAVRLDGLHQRGASAEQRAAPGARARDLPDARAGAGARREGVVDVRIQVEHDVWRGARQVAKFVAMLGTAIGFDAELRAPEAARRAVAPPQQRGAVHERSHRPRLREAPPRRATGP
jgi:hypothetical protein